MAQTFRSIIVILASLALLVAGSSLPGTLLAVRMSEERSWNCNGVAP